jgi:hypothetical protein
MVCTIDLGWSIQAIKNRTLACVEHRVKAQGPIFPDVGNIHAVFQGLGIGQRVSFLHGPAADSLAPGNFTDLPDIVQGMSLICMTCADRSHGVVLAWICLVMRLRRVEASRTRSIT